MEKGKKVLFITTKPPESLPTDILDGMNDVDCRDFLKNIIFRYCATASNLLKFLTELPTLFPKPDILIVDFLHTFFGDLSLLDQDKQAEKNFMQFHMTMASSVHGIASALTSILCIDRDYHSIYTKFIQEFIDFHYSEVGCILSTRDL